MKKSLALAVILLTSSVVPSYAKDGFYFYQGGKVSPWDVQAAQEGSSAKRRVDIPKNFTQLNAIPSGVTMAAPQQDQARNITGAPISHSAIPQYALQTPTTPNVLALDQPVPNDEVLTPRTELQKGDLSTIQFPEETAFEAQNNEQDPQVPAPSSLDAPTIEDSLEFEPTIESSVADGETAVPTLETPPVPEVPAPAPSALAAPAPDVPAPEAPAPELPAPPQTVHSQAPALIPHPKETDRQTFSSSVLPAAPAAVPSTVPSADKLYADPTEVPFPPQMFPEQQKPKRLITGNIAGMWQDGFLEDQQGFYLRQVWLTSEKKANAREKGIDLGYQVDAVFGTYNAQCYRDGGFDAKWGRSGDGYGASIKNLNAELGINDLSLRVGKFTSPLGFESADTTLNLFNTYTYMWSMEAVSHCGGMFAYSPNDKFQAQVGLTSGDLCSFENRRGDASIILDVKWQMTDTFSIRYASEFEQTNSLLGEDRTMQCYQYYSVLEGRSIADSREYMQCLSFTNDISKKLRHSIVTDYATLTDRVEKKQRYRMFGVANYLSYQVDELLTWAGRFEYFRQDLTESGKQEGISGSCAQNCYDVSFSANYRPMEAFMLRPEVRYDWTELRDKRDSGLTGSVGCLFFF